MPECQRKFWGFNEAGAGCPGIRRGLVDVESVRSVASMRPGQAAPVFGVVARAGLHGRGASMRPGQAAPVFSGPGRRQNQDHAASMRPGQAAPVFGRDQQGRGGRSAASMRPGQAAPVFRYTVSTCPCCRRCFNEAGAGCPGIPIISASASSKYMRFNEAGAGCPGIL